MTLRVILISCLLLGIINSANARPVVDLRVGVDAAYPPFSYQTIQGNFSGLNIDFAEALCQIMKVKCMLVPIKWDNFANALHDNRINLAIVPILINEKRHKLVDFSVPYLQLPSVVVVNKDFTLADLSNAKLQNMRLGALRSSPHAEYARVHLPSHITVYDKEEDYLRDLIQLKLDGVIGNPLLLNHWLQSEEGRNCCRMVGPLPHDLKINGEGFGIAIGKGQEELLQKINKALKLMKKSGMLAQIIQTHLPFFK